MIKKKDPYLTELEDIDHFDEVSSSEETNPDEEATRVDTQPPSASQESEYDLPQDLSSSGPSMTQSILDMSPDIPVQVVAVMGKKSVTVKDLLNLHLGQVMDLDKIPTDPVDLVVGGKIIAKAELVDVDGKLGLRVLKILK